jgi:hypothetical protein
MIDPSIITVATVAVGTAITQLASIFRDRQRRKAELENRELDSLDRKARALDVKSALETQAEIVLSTSHMHSAQVDTVLAEIKENTEISRNAFREGNDINTKIMKLYGRVVDLEDSLKGISAYVAEHTGCQNFVKKQE